jgi:hypothetical protein
MDSATIVRYAIIILTFIIVVLGLYYLIKWYYSSSSLSGLIPATTTTTITSDKLSNLGSGANSTNYTYSIWFYVNDWNYRYGETKVLYGRMGAGGGEGDVPGVPGTLPCPLVYLGPNQNDLTIAMSVYGNSVDPASGDHMSSTNSNAIIHNCSVSNIPIQKWVNLLVSTYGRSMDVYLDGKLVKTCLLPGISLINNDSNLYITPSGGFSGYTSKFQFFPHSTEPQTAWDIYQRGFSSGSNYNNYELKVSVIENGQEQNSVTI